MKRALAILISFLLGFSVLLAGPATAQAAPLPAPYGGSAGGDVNAVDLNVVDGVDLADVRLASSQVTVDSTDDPASISTSRNLRAAVPSLDVDGQSTQATAPPDSGPTDGTLQGFDEAGITLSAVNTTNEAHWAGNAACVANGLLASARTQTAGASITPVGLVQIVDTGDSETTGRTELVSTGGNGLNREIVSTATGTTSGATFLAGAVEVTVEGTSTLVASADGTDGGADVTYDPGTITVTFAGVSTVLDPGESRTIDVGPDGSTGQVVLTANIPDETVAADGQSASATVSVVSVEVRVGAAGEVLATASIDLLPLNAAANVPAGGIDCPSAAPVLTTPADGTVTQDTTPTFTGTGVPGATINLTLNGDVTTNVATVDADGKFSYTPTTPLPLDDYTASVTQTLNGATSVDSNQNDFRIVDTTAPADPTLVNPPDGSTTTDSTPTFTGTAEANSEVEIFVDGESIGTTTATAGGTYSFTPTTPIADGPHSANVIATDAAGNASDPSNTNAFIIDSTGPGETVLVNPADGSSTDDQTPTFTGTTDPNTEVEIFVDGDSIGTTTSDADGNFSFTPTTNIAPGPHSAQAVASDPAGNTTESNTNDFIVDLRAPAAPVLQTPADGSTTDDPTPRFSGTAEPNADVEIFVDGVSIGTTTADGDGNFSFTPTTPISEGAHTAYVVATDAAGNESRQSNTNGFTVDTTAPAPPVITSPDNGVSTDDTTPPIIGTAEPGSTVTIIIDGEPVGKVRADGDGNFTYTPTTPLTPGPHVITATATDASGNVSGSSEPVTPTITGGAGNSGGGGDDNGAGNGDNGTGATDDLADTGGPILLATLAGGLLLVGGCSALAARTLSRRRLI